MKILQTHSFRIKIAMLAGLLSGSMLIGFGWVFWNLNYQFSLSSIDREIQNFGNPNLNRRHGANHYDQFAKALKQILGEDADKMFIMVVRNERDMTIYQTPNWPDGLNLEIPQLGGLSTQKSTPLRGGAQSKGQSLPLKNPQFITLSDGSATWRVGVMGNRFNTLVLGLNIQEFHSGLEKMKRWYLGALFTVLGFTAIGSWLLANRALRPITVLTETLEGITAKGLSQRISTGTHAHEFQRLVSVFNDMMCRLEKSYLQAVRFSSNASHELRTPLAVLQGELEQLLHKALPDSEGQRIAGLMLEEVQRMKTVIEKLLLLSRADTGDLRVERSRIDLSQSVSNLAEDIVILAPHLKVETKITEHVEAFADSHLLHQVFQNLAANAIKYNRIDGMICIYLIREKGVIEMRIGNTGPCIPVKEQDRIFDRFYRGSSSKEIGLDGMGLGLSLCREILRAHGGDLSLERSDHDRTVFLIKLKSNENDS